ncbi:MAG TPA: alpha/beta hydrolase-fold protein [Thermoanaerobaculia bacterium]|nr:alpha/beta hydrolase-fold protein [Thermoanaerobaculia bacterium]
MRNAILVLLLAVPAFAKGVVKQLTIEDTYYKRTRNVWVYTPEQTAKSYPLIVLFDGDSYIKDIPAPDTLDELIAAKKIPPMMAIMVDNTADRLGDLANHQKFADFIALQLIPWARAKWPAVAKDASGIATGGASAGGLAAAYVAYRHPEVVGNVLSQSGAYWRGNEGGSSPTEWLTEQFRASKKLPIKFYMEVGALETQKTAGGPIFIEATRRLRDVLREKGYAIQYLEAPNSHHEETHWRAQFGPGVVGLFGK